MHDFQQQNQLQKTFSRFNKIRLYSVKGYNNLLPISVFQKSSYKYQQIQLNTKYHFNAIIMDVDNENLLTEWNSQGLPTPTIQTVNMHNNKAHLVWLLNVPVYKKHQHAVDYYKAIVNSIKKLIGADPAYQNHQTKNFLNTKLFRITYNDVSYDLGDFRSFITVGTDRNDREVSTDYLVGNSRHIHLFESLRKYGYTIANLPDLKYQLTKKAEYINQFFDKPIKVKYIVNAVYRFCEEHKDNFKDKNRKRVMKFEKIKNLSKAEFKEEVKNRQRKSAERTTTIKKIKTSAKIKVAIDALLRQKKSLTIQNIANQVKISVSTVRRNIKIINIFIHKSHGFIRSIRLIVQRAKRICIGSIIEDNNWLINQKFNYKHKFKLSPPI